jgi:anthranilate synthase component II
MKKILVFDNYDSFTYNLVHAIKKICGETAQIDVFRNDEIALEEIARYDKIVLSPGPGIPSEAGILLQVIEKYAPTKSIFGVCLGMQAIGEVFGGKLVNLNSVFHGIASEVEILDKDEPIFKGLPEKIEAGRYHSWVVDKATLPNCLKPTAVDNENLLMALRHKEFDVCGVQFHPESILTPKGEQILTNWLK